MEPTTAMEKPLVSDRKACYAAFKAHDARFDGRIFVCVSSTGIYCRPVCRVRMPKEANCAFLPSAAAAEAAGYRPCLKCRPELAPGFAPVDASSRLARWAALVIEKDCLCDSDLSALSETLGVSDRHVRRVFVQEYGVSPIRYLQTRRLLLAKSLLTDTGLPVTRVAFAAGFDSVRRFNDLFRKQYRMTPGALRKSAAGTSAAGHGGITLFLGYRPPYGWDRLLSFLEGRAIPGVESVAGGVYRRTAAVRSGDATHQGWIAVEHAEGKNALAVTVASELLPVLPKILSRVRNLFDLDCEPGAVFESLSAMNDLKPGMCVPGVRVPGSFDAFEMAVRAILGQQVTVKAARTLAARVAERFGETAATPFAELARVFPTPAAICGLGGSIESHLGPLGVIGSRARTIAALAAAMHRDEDILSPGADPERQMRLLMSLPGIGEWTAQYLAMRALGWADAFPHTDYGVKKALDGRAPGEILKISEQWRPWRAYATVNLWNSL